MDPQIRLRSLLLVTGETSELSLREGLHSQEFGHDWLDLLVHEFGGMSNVGVFGIFKGKVVQVQRSESVRHLVVNVERIRPMTTLTLNSGIGGRVLSDEDLLHRRKDNLFHEGDSLSEFKVFPGSWRLIGSGVIIVIVINDRAR